MFSVDQKDPLKARHVEYASREAYIMSPPAPPSVITPLRQEFREVKGGKGLKKKKKEQ